MSKIKRRLGAWSPEARAKAVATRARNKAAKLRATSNPLPEEHVSLDAIPDRAPRKKKSRANANANAIDGLQRRNNNLLAARALLATVLDLLERV